MYEELIENELSIPFDIDNDNFIIKSSDIDVIKSIEEEIKILEEENKKTLELKKESISKEIETEKQRILENIHEKSSVFFEQQDTLLESMSTSLNDIIIQLLEKLSLDISYTEKLKFSIEKILENYRHKENLCLIVRSTSAFDELGVHLPEGWDLKEDPSIDGDCKLELAGGAIECSFDDFFAKLVENISNIKF